MTYVFLLRTGDVNVAQNTLVRSGEIGLTLGGLEGTAFDQSGTDFGQKAVYYVSAGSATKTDYGSKVRASGEKYTTAMTASDAPTGTGIFARFVVYRSLPGGAREQLNKYPEWKSAAIIEGYAGLSREILQEDVSEDANSMQFGIILVYRL